MRSVNRLPGRAGIRAALLLILGIAVDGAEASQDGNPKLLLQVEGDSVSADIRGVSLAELARAVERKIGARIHFAAPWMKGQRVNARFAGLTPERAVQSLLAGNSYALVRPAADGKDGMQIYLCSSPPASDGHREVATREASPHDGPLDPESWSKSHLPADPRDPPSPPDEFDPDPASRTFQLQAAVAAHGQQSLPLILAGTQDTDTSVRSASERLLLDGLRNVVPKEVLSRMALTSDDADVRQQALEVIAAERNDPEYARITLDSALRDADPGVQQRARELLEQLFEPKLADADTSDESF
jgi:hypothetical protein